MTSELSTYRSMESMFDLNRRSFIKAGTCAGVTILLGTPPLWSGETTKEKPGRVKTNIADLLSIPRTEHSIPGPFPGRVVKVYDPKATGKRPGKTDAKIVHRMFKRGITHLTGTSGKKSFPLFFEKNDVVGIKVNPVGGNLISSHLNLVDAIIDWLLDGGIKRKNIVIWDRFDIMLKEAGFVRDRFPGVRIEGLQTMDEAAYEGKAKDDSGWLDAKGKHKSEGNFDKNVYYWADVDGPKDKPYLNQHVVNGKYSYFGKLVTQELTKIINVPVFKNTGNGISMATKNLGYGSICNTGRLHNVLFFDVCTEVLAFPSIRDKLVLNVLDGLIGQYEGGPMPAPKFTYPFNSLFFSTDPFALDRVGHTLMVKKRKAMGVKVNEHPRYTEYLRYAQKLGLGITDPGRIKFLKV